MKDDFREKMNQVMQKGILEARKKDKDYLAKVDYNKKFADLYTELVLAVVEQFDYHKLTFNTDNIDEELIGNFGKPRDVSAWIKNDEPKGVIALDYSDETGWERVGEPEFRNDYDFDLNIVNDILAENDIHIRRDSVDGGGVGTQNDYIYFDASMLLETRNKLSEESPKLYLLHRK